MAKVSYLFAIITFLLTCFELVRASHSMYNLRVGKILKALKLSQTIDEKMKDENENLKTRWKMIKARDRYEKEYNYLFGMSKMFFLVGLDLKKTESFILRSVKMFGVFKSILFSLLINSLQMTPKSQISLILCI